MENVRFFGEYVAIATAVSWTATAMLSELASRRLGALALNVVRMAMALCFLSVTLFFLTGSPFPLYTDSNVWLWLSLSGLVGYVFGDMCLFNAYLIIGSRFGQLFMTIAPGAAAVASYILLGETISSMAILGMIVTMTGIGISVFARRDNEKGRKKIGLKLPLKGVVLGLGAGVGQGVGLVLSKVGMSYYEPLYSTGYDNPLVVPFSSTFVRSVTGFLGFVILMFYLRKTGKLYDGVRDAKGMMATMMATVFGPFVGVSMSLMAVQYTAAGIAQTLMALTPIFILLPSWFFYKQKITVLEILGAMVSVAGVSLFFV